MSNQKKTNNSLLLVVALAVIVIFFFMLPNLNNEEKEVVEPINGMIMLIEFEKIEGILQFEREFGTRGLTAMVKAQDNVLEEYPDVFKRLADQGYEIAGGYDEAPFWGMPYEEQYEHLAKSKELVERVSGKSMRVFGSRYFAYDENTLKAADALGIEYILGRGVNDVEATIYQPEEYSTRVISVSNVDVGEMGRGSLCDYSLWARGSDADEFGEMYEDSITKEPTNLILVSHAYLGGTRLEWWQEYLVALNDERVTWRSFDDWLASQEVITLPNAEIPVNLEVKYVAPAPAKEIEEYEAIPGLYIEGELSPEFSEQMMCQ